MNVQIRTVHFEADTKLIEHVQNKIKKLSTFHDHIISVEIYLRLDNMAHTVKDKVAEIKVYVPKHSYFVKNQTKTFEEAFDQAFLSMVNQVKRQKEKIMA